jgi:hypothetical protein
VKWKTVLVEYYLVELLLGSFTTLTCRVFHVSFGPGSKLFFDRFACPAGERMEKSFDAAL